MNQVMGLKNSIANPYAAMMNRKQPAGAMHKTEDVRAKLRQLTQNRQSVYDGFSQSARGNFLINATLDYGKTIREQRKQTKDSLIQLKSVKYQFKNISSQILRAKTSTSARQAVGQAEREVLRLKREKMKEGVDETEIDAAITHAKAMERVARRKVKHLLQEEMAEASGTKETMVTEEEIYSIGDVKDNEGKRDKITDDAEPEETVERVEDLLEDMSREMQELMEDTGLEELNDALEAETADMEPEDIKMLKIKHRNKEMKDIVKADSEYLKAVFDHLEEQKNGAMPASMSMPTGDIGVGADFSGNISVEPSIDIAL